MDPNSTFGISAENRVILKDGNYRVWVTLLEQHFKSQKLWSHITNTAVRPPAPRVVTPGVAAVAAGNGIAAVAAIAENTQEQVDSDNRKIEDFEAAIAKANFIFLQHIEQKHVGALYGYDSLAAKWQNYRRTTRKSIRRWRLKLAHVSSRSSGGALKTPWSSNTASELHMPSWRSMACRRLLRLKLESS